MKTSVIPMPHSWSICHWPENVFPNSVSRARYLVRVHKLDLIAAGALVRVGRELVVIGVKYGRWLERRGAEVVACEPNVTRGAARSRTTETEPLHRPVSE
jgi:hypothetical protein